MVLGSDVAISFTAGRRGAGRAFPVYTRGVNRFRIYFNAVRASLMQLMNK